MHNSDSETPHDICIETHSMLQRFKIHIQGIQEKREYTKKLSFVSRLSIGEAETQDGARMAGFTLG